MKATLRDHEWTGETVLVRVDYNVPLKDGVILDDRRMTATIPTISYLREHGARVILVTHVGRPDGTIVPGLSTKPIAEHLSDLLNTSVHWVPTIVGPEALQLRRTLAPGEVAMLENVRFDPREEKNDPTFASELAALGSVYCNDAFGTAHRAHASTEGVAHLLPAVAGFLMEREIALLTRAVEHPDHPYLAIIGGAKISSKISILEAFLSRVDAIAIGGAMAATFLEAQGIGTGRSLIERDQIPIAREILRRAAERGVAILLPSDVVVTDDVTGAGHIDTVPVTAIPSDRGIVDVGPSTVAAIEAAAHTAALIVWNGPFGIYEIPAFAAGTVGIAHAITAGTATTIIGGGDVVAALEHDAVISRFTHVSTGGGATLELLEGKNLPGIAAIGDTPTPATMTLGEGL